MEIIGVTGGIGSGKSVVCRFLRILGYSVYDSDERAKVLMDSSTSIKSALVAEFGADVCIDGVLDRRRLAEIVFADAMALNRLNAIVHPAVKSDFKEWCERRQGERAVFIESAILIEAGFPMLSIRYGWLRHRKKFELNASCRVMDVPVKKPCRVFIRKK